MKHRMLIYALLALVPVVFIFSYTVSAGLDDDEYKELTKEAKKSLKKDQFAAVNAIKKLGKDDSERAAEFVFELAISTKTPPMVYRQCIETLASFTSKEACAYIAKQAAGSKTPAKIIAADVLAKLPGDEALDALITLTRDNKEAIARIAAKSLGIKGDTKAMDALIELLEKTQERHGLPWQEALIALRKLAGTDESGPWIAADWRDFWAAKKRQEEWKKTNQDAGKAGPHTELPDFFGAKVASTRVIFIMDLSSSMLESDAGGQRLARMKQELSGTIDKLDKDTQFNVLGFNSKLFPWKTKLAPANDKNKANAKDFIKKMKAIAYTNTDDALKVAFTDKNADTIILLSDGIPLRKEHKDQMSDAFILGILDWVGKVNRFRRVVIQTFGFDAIANDPGGERCVAFLTKLAQQNDGEYHNIK